MLSKNQRDRIVAGLAPVTTWPITPIATANAVNWVPRPPDVVLEVVTQGVRKQGFMDLMRDSFDGVNWHEWRGHISRATIKLTIEATDARTLESQTYAIYNNIWKYEAGLGREESPEGDYLMFRGCDPPKFLPPYQEDPTWPLRSVIEYFVDYYDTVETIASPIEEIALVADDNLGPLTIRWPEKFYTIDAVFAASGVPKTGFYSLDAMFLDK